MANGADGSLEFDTSLDNTGFERGSSELLAAIKGLTQAVDNLGDNMMSSFSQVISLMSSMASVITNTNRDITETATQAVNANTQMIDVEQAVAQAAQQAAQAVAQQVQGNDAFVASILSAKDNVSALGKEISSIASGMQSMNQSAEKGFGSGQAVLSFSNKLDSMEAKIESAKSKLEAFANTEVPTEHYQWVTETLAKTERQLQSLEEKQARMSDTGVKENSKSWQRVQYDIDQARAAIQTYKQDMAAMRASGQAYMRGQDTGQYAAMKAQLDGAAAALERNKALINSEAIEQAKLNVLAAQEGVISATTSQQREMALANLRMAQQELANVASQASLRPVDPGVSASWQGFGNMLRTSIVSALRSVGAAMMSVPVVAFRAGISGLSAAFRGIAGAAAGAWRGINRLTAALRKYTTRSKSATLSSKSLVRSLISIRTMLISRLREMFITKLFQAIRESMVALAKFDSKFQQSMSNISNSAKQMGANISVGLAGLITAIEPVLTAIINAISTAITYLNAFFAMLGGRSTITVGAKQMGKFGEETAGAAGAAAELKRQVYGFDELNKRSSDSGGGGGGASAEDLFEQVAISDILPESLQNTFEQIKAAIAANDWHEVGFIIAGGLNSGMAFVDNWITGTFRPMADTWATRMAEGLNGLVDGIDWPLMGDTVAHGIDAVFIPLHTFLSTFDFDALGRGVSVALSNTLANADWNTVGAVFGDKWNAVTGFIYGIVSNKGMWDNLGKAFADGVNGFTKTVDWRKIGAAVSDGAKGLLTSINIALQSVDWQQLGRELCALLSAVDWTGITVALSEGIGGVLGGLAAILWGLIEDAWNDVVDWWYDAAYEDGAFTMDGLLAGIWDAICDIGTWVKTNIFDPFIKGFKAAFGIHSPSTVMAEQGGFIVEGLLQGISKAWGSITDWFTEKVEGIKDSCSNGWERIKDGASTAWESIKTAVTNPFSSAKSKLSTDMTSVKSSMSNGWNSIKSGASTSWTGIKSAVTGAFSNTKTSLGNDLNSLKSSMSNGWTSIKTTSTNLMNSMRTAMGSTMTTLANNTKTSLNGIKSTASTAWNSIKSATTSTWSSISSTITSKWNSLRSTMNNTNWYSVGSNICTGIRNGINAGWSWLSSTVSTLARNLLSRAKSALGIHSPSRVFRDEVGQNIGLGLAEGISDSEPYVTKTIGNLANATANGFDADLSIGAVGVDMVNGLDVVASKLAVVAETFRAITDMLTSMGGFTAPSIASGEYIPARTRIDTSSGPIEVDGFKSFASDFEEYMAENADLLRQIIDLLRRGGGNIDMAKLAKAMTSAQRSAVRSYGL